MLMSTINVPIFPIGVGDVEALAGAGGRYELADAVTTARTTATVTRCQSCMVSAVLFVQPVCCKTNTIAIASPESQC